jgi:hypothetical protein
MNESTARVLVLCAFAAVGTALVALPAACGGSSSKPAATAGEPADTAALGN